MRKDSIRMTAIQLCSSGAGRIIMLTYTIKGLNGCERLIRASIGPPLCILVGKVACLDILDFRAVRAIGFHHLLVALILCLHKRGTGKPQSVKTTPYTAWFTLRNSSTIKSKLTQMHTKDLK